MNKNYGQYGLAIEKTEGAAETTPAVSFYMSADSDGIDVSTSTDKVRLTSGGRDTTAGRFVSGLDATAKGTTIGFADFVGMLLYSALGADEVTGSAAPYTHDIKMGEKLPAVTVFEQKGSLSAPVQTLAGCKLNSLTISAEGTTPPSFEFEYAGCEAKWTDVTTWPGPAVDVDGGWFKTAGAEVLFSLVDGNAAAVPAGVNLSSVEIGIKNNVEKTPALSEVAPRRQTEGATEVSIKLSGTSDSTELYREVKTGSKTGSTVSGVVVTGALQITFPHLSKDWSLVVKVPEIPWEIDAMGVSVEGGPFDLSLSTDGAIAKDGSSIEFILQNAVAKYAIQ